MERAAGRTARCPEILGEAPYSKEAYGGITMSGQINRRFFFLFLSVALVGCGGGSTSPSGGVSSDTYDVDAKGIPRFVGTDYIESAKIQQISKFRSGEGHDYSDDFETCRSMKHYFQPKGSVDWGSVRIFSPVNGTVADVIQEWAGAQVAIKSEEYPAFRFIIFHINLTNPLKVGDVVSAGQQLGTHIGSQTMSDIAVGVNTPKGYALVSYFATIMDSVFQPYQARGVSSRETMVISKAARDASSLACSGETFANIGILENWLILN